MSLTGPAASNPFTAELGLLTKLVAPRVSRAKDDASLPAPKPVKEAPGRKRRSVPPLNDMEVAVGEVQTLPTHGKLQLGVSSTNHAGLKEMLISRKARHEQAFEAYKKRTGQLEVELEARTAHVARSFKQLMALNDAELKTMFEELADDFLLQMEMEEVDSSWVRIDEELHRRFSWVTQFETDLGKVEDERREMIEAELTTLLEALVATAHLLPPQLERLVETEAHQVNLLILSNREAHADLIARLRVDDVKRHKANREEWEARKAAWRRLRHDHAILTLKSFLHSPEVISPLPQQELLAELAAGQQRFHERRVAISAQLSDLRPPILTKNEASKVRTQLEELLAEEGQFAASCTAQLRKAEEAVAAEVADAEAYLRQRLAHFAAHPPEVLERLFQMQIQPLIVLRAEQAKDLISRIARAERRQRLKVHEDALTLAARFEGAGRIFDEHAEATKELYAGLRGDLATLRQDHELRDKESELALEEALMAMRRASDKTSLQEQQDAAMQLLHEVQTGYRDFHAHSLERIAQHPGAVAAELSTLQAELVDFHRVKTRDEYDEGAPEAAEPEAAPPAEEPSEEAPAEGGAEAEADESAPAEAPPEDAETDILDLTKPLDGEENLWATFGLIYPQRMDARVALDDELAGLEAANRAEPAPDPYAFTTVGGRGYQMLTPSEVVAEDTRRLNERLAAAKAASKVKSDDGATPRSAAADDDGAPPSTMPPTIDISAEERAARLLPRTYGGTACLAALVAPVETGVRVALAKACLSYHEQHAAAMAERTASEHATLEKQLTRELDERLMAHRPRAGHVETDMAAQRDTELLAHRERFVRHVKTLNARRQALRAGLEEQVNECARAEATHASKNATIQRALGSERNNHTMTLQRLSREAEAAHALYGKLMNETFDGLKAKANETMREVLASNAKFRDTWKPFADGGHFNEEERERFVERLAKVDEEAKMEAAEQAARLRRLHEDQVARAEQLLEGFHAALKINMQDIHHIEVMKMQQGKATADVRIVLAESAAQQTAIDAQTATVEKLLRSGKRKMDGGAGGASSGGEAGGDAGGDEGGTGGSGEAAMSMRILKATGEMRMLLLQRAKFLEVISATAMPETCLPILQDPPPEGDEDGVAEGEGEGVAMFAMSERVKQAREKHEAEMIRFCEEYHEARGERAVTRPSLIPSDVEEHKAKIQGILDHMSWRAEDERLVSVKALRQQLLQIWRLLNLVGMAVFDDISATARLAAQERCTALEKDFAPLAKDRAKKREIHQAALKPTLCNAAKQSELRALAQAEADRSAASIAAAEKLREDMLAAETEQAAVVLRRLLHQSKSMLSLLDAMIAQEDLVAADEPPLDVHHGLKKKLRMETREMALDSSQDAPQEGRDFMLHVWHGLPLGELMPDNLERLLTAGSDAKPVPAAEGTSSTGDGGEPVAPELSEELTSNMTRSHRSVISARDKTYAAYRLHYAGRVKAINAACEVALSEERQWTTHWKKLVNRIAIEKIDE